MNRRIVRVVAFPQLAENGDSHLVPVDRTAVLREARRRLTQVENLCYWKAREGLPVPWSRRC